MINHFDTIHVPEVRPYKTYSYPEFGKKVILLFKIPDKTRVNIKELRSAEEKTSPVGFGLYGSSTGKCREGDS